LIVKRIVWFIESFSLLNKNEKNRKDPEETKRVEDLKWKDACTEEIQIPE
jgi:hypothetical protein